MSQITYAQPAVANKSNAGSAAPSATLASAPTQGNRMLCAIVAEEATANTVISMPGSWTLMGTKDVANNVQISVYQKVAAAGESATQTGSLTGGSHRWVMWIAELVGASTSGFLDDFRVSSGSGNPLSSATFPTNFPDELWLAFFGIKGNVNLSGETNGYAEILESGTSGASNNVTLGIESKDVSATGNAQVNATQSANNDWVCVSIAIRSIPAATPISGSDSGSGSDSASQKAAISASDSGSGSDTAVAQTNQRNGTDAGTGTESATLQVQVAATDTATTPLGGFGEDPFGTVPFGVAGEETQLSVISPVVDSGTAAEAIALLARIQVTEAFNYVEIGGTQLSTVNVNGSDVGSGVEALSLAAAFAISDSAIGAESGLVVAQPAVADTGLGSDVSTLAAKPIGIEVGAGADSATVISAKPNVSDSGSGADTGVLKTALAVNETISVPDDSFVNPKLTGSEIVNPTESMALQARVQGNDTATSDEAAVSPQVTFQIGFDDATALESFSLLAKPSVADTGSGSENAQISVPLSVSETGHGAETGSVKYEFSLSENGTATESAVVTVRFAAVDTGEGIEYSEIGVAVSVVQTGSGLDVPALVASLIGLENAGESEVARIGLFVSDSGSGSEEHTELHASIPSFEIGHGIDGSFVQHVIRDRFPGNPPGLVMLNASTKKAIIINSKPPTPTVQEVE